MASDVVMERDGVRLAGIDFGGRGPAVLLLHGLAGHAGEWTGTAGWLTDHAHVVALDARGHGASERRPTDVSRAAHVADAAFAIEQLGLGPVVVIGQSLGGVTALLLAAERPQLVRGVVLADAHPGGGDPADRAAAVDGLRRSLQRWPVPFPSRAAALEFFGGRSPAAEAWADGLERRDGEWWPRFDVDALARTLDEASSRSYWEHWRRIACPVLVVRAGEGIVSDVDARAMAEQGRDVEVVSLPGAKHDVHLDRPDDWRQLVSGFLDRVQPPPA